MSAFWGAFLGVMFGIPAFAMLFCLYIEITSRMKYWHMTLWQAIKDYAS